jgi:hypothetical protein
MVKLILITLVFALLNGCGGEAPKRKAKPLEPYVVLFTAADSATSQLTVAIQVDPPITEEAVKKAAGMVIENNKASYKNIVVKSFTSSNASGIPYGTTYFDGQNMTHQFNPQAAPQKIPSH